MVAGCSGSQDGASLGSYCPRLPVFWGPLPERCYPMCGFASLFVHSRTSTPTSYPQVHCKGAQARHCAAALRLVIRDMHEWAPAGSCDDIPYFDFVWGLIRSLASFYEWSQSNASGCQRRRHGRPMIAWQQLVFSTKHCAMLSCARGASFSTSRKKRTMRNISP